MIMSMQCKSYSCGGNKDQLDISTISAHGFYSPHSEVTVSLKMLNRWFLMLQHISHSLEA